ncbi:hypothetical protein AMATHDRAFT_11224 [Amanita thiersii Skay4041]|uniref:Uncharacterized protein n=1 Tax=Amanita thiersii Skay4041 TaxID=703135 RepID=A0A2A9N6H8_9AGAR|nr:hypothetical protein AMATHDRAFT_11224 [Amanita thiersii Skay4041]
MKLFNALIFSTLTAAAFAQNAAIGSPGEGERLAAGSSVMFEIDRPNSLTGSQEIAVVIGLASCAKSPCASPKDIMGRILYNGPFNPRYQDSMRKPPHDNFTLTIPENFAKGPAQLNVAHAALIGAGPFPFLETLNRSLVIV